MKEALLQLPKEQLADKVIELEKKVLKVDELEAQLAWLKRQLFGQKRERFVPEDPNQMALDLGLEAREKQQAEEEQVSFTRKKKKRKEKPFRQPLPDGLRRVTEIIEPDRDLAGAVRMGEVVTEILEYKQAEFWVRRIVRPQYVWPGQEEKGIAIAELPSRPIDKAIAGASLLAQIILNKYVDHLPLYRQIQRFKRLGIKVPMSTPRATGARRRGGWRRRAGSRGSGARSPRAGPADRSRPGSRRGSGGAARRAVRSSCSTTRPRAARRCRSDCYRAIGAICRPTTTRATGRWAPGRR